MDELRNNLLNNDLIDTYQTILNFLRSPSNAALEEILSNNDLPITIDIQQMLESVLNQFLNDKEGYYKYITLGQVVIWQEIYNTYRALKSLGQKIEQASGYPGLQNYNIHNKELSDLLRFYSDMQAELTYLEDTLGIDRFLDRIGEGTFSVLNNYVLHCKSILENKCEAYKQDFQKEWNTTNVFNILCHKLIRYDTDNSICDLVSGNNKQVILFLIDGFGYCQYMWHKSIDSKHKNYTFKENIFNWLSEVGCSKELILGSSYITDTGAGLAQIFSGKISKSTAIIASKVLKRNSRRNFEATKTLSLTEFNSLFNAQTNSITDIVCSSGYDSTIYYCSRYEEAISGFSSFLFKSGEVRQVTPAERVFSVLEADISRGTNSGLQIIYYTGIDNTGHTMGAYSGFEKYEHIKIDELFRNFLIELGKSHSELFDGTRSILLTADHGMYESSKKIISRHMLQDLLRSAGYYEFKLVENNRAMFLYTENKDSIANVKSIMNEYFVGKNLIVDITSDVDPLFYQCFSDGIDSNVSAIAPDIVMRFVGNGLFYTNPSANEHLLHYGGHGGYSVDEVFVPLIEIVLDCKLLDEINRRFLSKL